MGTFLDKFIVSKPKLDETTKENPRSAKVPGDLWVKCKGCDTPIYRKVLEEKLKVCDKCGFHHKMTSFERIALLTDAGSFEEMDMNVLPIDPLNFGSEYTTKLADDQRKTGLNDAILTGTGKIGGHKAVLGVMEFFFRGASMGSVVGEKIARALEYGAEHKLPVIMVTCSGGARMQEGVFSLMQLVKTNAAVNLLGEAKMPYIVIMTDPTTAGVAASFAAIGDIILAEPGATIGFSGRRVIEQTIRQKLPPDFQTSEFYLKHGFIDDVIQRKNMKKTLIRILNLYFPANSQKISPEKLEREKVQA